MIFISIMFSGCETKGESSVLENETTIDLLEENVTININLEETFQTIESFGASGAWWSQDVGGWTEKDKSGVSKRELITQLLFDSEDGIGLTSYRYNLGAGSNLKNSPKIEDSWRRAENFEREPGVYDWSKDENSKWILKKQLNMV